MKLRTTVALGTLFATVLVGSPAQAAPLAPGAGASPDSAHALKLPTAAKGGSDDDGAEADDDTEIDDENEADDETAEDENEAEDGGGTTPEDPVTPPTDPVPADPGQHTAPNAPSIGAATAGDSAATVRWQAPTVVGDTPISEYEVQAILRPSGQVSAVAGVAAGVTSLKLTGLANGTVYAFRVRAVNEAGPGAFSGLSNIVIPTAPRSTSGVSTTPADPTPPTTQQRVPGAPRITSTRPGDQLVELWWAAPTSDGGSPITRYRVQVLAAGEDTPVTDARVTSADTTHLVITGLTNGRPYRLRVRAVNAIGTGAPSTTRVLVTPRTVPGRPTHLSSTRGPAGGPVTASVAWTAPRWTGGAAVAGYRVTGQRLTASGEPVGAPTTFSVPAWERGTTFTARGRVPAGTWYRFTVRAYNAAGTGAGRTTVSMVR